MNHPRGWDGGPDGLAERIPSRVADGPETEREMVLRPGCIGVLRGSRTHVVGSPSGRLDLPRASRQGDTGLPPARCQTEKTGMIWEQRWHPLRREWVVVSPTRNRGPWRARAWAHPPTALPPSRRACTLP